MNANENTAAMRQPSATIRGFAFTSGKYYPVDPKTGQRVNGKGAENDNDGTAGVLVVHPVRNATGVNYPLYIGQNERKGIEFDYIVEAGTTVDISKVTVFPAE